MFFSSGGITLIRDGAPANKFLFPGGAPANKLLFPGGDPANKFLFPGGAPANKFLFPGGAPANNLFQKDLIPENILNSEKFEPPKKNTATAGICRTRIWEETREHHKQFEENEDPRVEKDPRVGIGSR